jgi:hypothetical protein
MLCLLGTQTELFMTVELFYLYSPQFKKLEKMMDEHTFVEQHFGQFF